MSVLIGDYVHSINSLPYAIIGWKSCHRQHINRVERRLKNEENFQKNIGNCG